MKKLSTLLRAFAIGTMAMATLSQALAAASDSARPNIILIIGDDISEGDFGCYGHPHIQTPNVDKLAAEGLRFTNAYLTASSCSPSRCSIISGRYPHNTGAPELHQGLVKGQPMFPLELKKNGYYTAGAGKFHLGDYAMGAFDKFLNGGGGLGKEEHWLPLLQERPKDKPFFMWFASSDAHWPFQASTAPQRRWQNDNESEKHSPSDAVIPPFMADTRGTRVDLAAYYDEVQRLDHYVGAVVEELKKQDILDQTIIIFMADNGRPFPRCKTWLYDSGIKTPFIIRWPGGSPQAGTVSDSLVSAIDIAPSILEWAGVATPEAMQGTSMGPILKDPGASIREYAFAEHNWHVNEAHKRMVRWKKWVYIRNARHERRGAVADYFLKIFPPYRDLLNLKVAGKLSEAQSDIFRAPRPKEMLFNTEADPDQLNNLANHPEHAEVLAHMRAKLDQWAEQTGDTVPENLTPDIIDRETGERLDVDMRRPPRGTIPGSERNATEIDHPGPR